MAHIEFHWGGMALAAVAAFIFGFLWYGPLFGRRWGEEMGFDMDAERPSMGSMMWPMIGQLVGAFLTAYTLTWVLGGLADHWTDWGGFHAVLMVSLIAWSGFYLPIGFSSVGWEQRSWSFFGINTGFHFLNLLLIGSMVTFIPF